MSKFSVIIPVFNKEKDIYNTLESVLKQSFSDFELIIVDDGSTDKSVEEISRLKDKRILVFKKENQGVSIARNFGVEKSNSDYIAFLDADDYWYPEHLENLLLLINEFPKKLWFASAYEKKRNSALTTPMNSPILKKGKTWFGVIDFFKNSMIDSVVNSSSVCFNKDFYNSLNGFNSNFTHGEDTDLWIRSSLKSPLVFSNKITLINNLDSSNRSNKTPISKRNYFNLNAFTLEEKTNLSLNKFLDLNRYSQAIKYKTEGGNKKIVQRLTKHIKLKNLNKKQKFLLKQNNVTLKLMISFQVLLEKLGIRFSSF